MAEEALEEPAVAAPQPVAPPVARDPESVLHHFRPGIVVDEDAARDSACIVYHTKRRRGGEAVDVYSPGVIGRLDDRQQALYCPDFEHRDLSPEEEAQRAQLDQAGRDCKTRVAGVPGSARERKFVDCMLEYLASKPA